tara:strand:+ start:295 stop:1002 length:708 start_codon:yes stop_codon:yes gene_type:complete
MPNYQDSKIYKIVNPENNLVYYGSTTHKNLNCRFSQHKQIFNSCSSRYLFIEGTQYIELLENFPCENKKELELKERWYIENNECVNQHIPGRNKQEWYESNVEERKVYYQKNKTKIMEQHKKNYMLTREKVLKRKKEYYEENKKKILEKQKIHYEKDKERKKKRNIDYYNNNKEKILLRNKIWKQNNPEKVKEMAKRSNEKTKKKIICDCGSTIGIHGIKKHERSKKHKNYLATL